MTELHKIISDILAPYSKEPKSNEMKEAKDKFIELTGRLDEDSREYESRLNSFEEWFIFEYENQKVLNDYLESKEEPLEQYVVEGLKNINHSVFHFKKINFFNKAIFVDLINKNTIKIPNKKMDLTLVEGDLFVGRIFSNEKDYSLLKGICLLPEDSYKPINKRIKKIRKSLDADTKQSFLMQIEKLKNKSIHYGHVKAKDLFIFE